MSAEPALLVVVRRLAELRGRVVFVGGAIRGLLIVDAPHFCATKLDAYADRGKGQLVESHDLEDVIAVVDGRASLRDELAATGREVRTFVARQLQDLLATTAFLEALPGHLPGDAASQDRLPLLLERLHALAALG